MSGGRGYNTFHGFDTGPLPPGFVPGQPPVANFWPRQAAEWPNQPVVPFPPVVAFAPAQNYPYPFPHQANNGGFSGTNHNEIIPPGYNYAFPQEHTKIHVFTTKEKPWQNSNPLWNWDASKHMKLVVPSNTTVKELMQNLGANNENAKKNILHEVTEQGNGRWSKGLTITGDDKDRVKKSIREFGWDKSRTGNPGERPLVWLYVTKD